MVTVVTTRGGAYDRRCGTQPREQGFEEDEAHLKRLMKTSDVDENIVINTYFHVISSGDLEDEDEIPDHRLYSQVCQFVFWNLNLFFRNKDIDYFVSIFSGGFWGEKS